MAAKYVIWQLVQLVQYDVRNKVFFLYNENNQILVLTM